MVSDYVPHYTLTSTIVSLMERLARFEGRLQASAPRPHEYGEIQSLAAIDAVHFSTKLEGNPLTYKEVTRALTHPQKSIRKDRNLKEVLNYARVRKQLFDQAKNSSDLTIPHILRSHDGLLTGIVRGTLKGYFRTAQNVIRDSKTHRLVYLPPVAADVAELMTSLVNWVRRARLDGFSPLLIAPIFHYRFVTLHPFMDGNGRLARLLTNFILLSLDYSVPCYAAIEKQHENNRARYYDALRQLQRSNFYDIPPAVDLAPWIQYWLECLSATYDEALSRIGAMAPHPQEWATTEPRLQKALAVFAKYKQLRAADYEVLMGLRRTQSVSDLQRLVALGHITKIGGGRSTRYQVVMS